MKPFPGPGAIVDAADLIPGRPKARTDEDRFLLPIESFAGRGYFLRLLLERWKHRHEEPFDTRGAIEHLEIMLSTNLPQWNVVTSDEKYLRDMQRDIEELLTGLRKEKSFEAQAGSHRNRDQNHRPVRHESNMTSILEHLLWLWRNLSQRGSSTVN